MSGYLIDTHVWYWLLFDDPALKHKHQQSLADWQLAGMLYLSPISAWEATKKQDSGKLDLTGTVEEWLANSVGPGDLQLLDLTVPILMESNRLPG